MSQGEAKAIPIHEGVENWEDQTRWAGGYKEFDLGYDKFDI